MNIKYAKDNQAVQDLIQATVDSQGFKTIMALARSESSKTVVMDPSRHTEAYGNVAFGIRVGYDRLADFMENLPSILESGKGLPVDELKPDFTG